MSRIKLNNTKISQEFGCMTRNGCNKPWPIRSINSPVSKRSFFFVVVTCNKVKLRVVYVLCAIFVFQCRHV